MIAHTLSVFDIKKAVGENGKEIEPVVEFSPGILSHLAPFKASFVTRSKDHEQLIVDFENHCPFEKGDAAVLEDVLSHATWNK